MKKAFIFIALILFTFTLCAEATTIDKDFLATLNDVLKESGYEVVKKEKSKGWWQTQIEEASSFNDIFFRASMVRDSSLSYGGGVNIGLESPSFQFALYTLGDYFPSPLGGQGGGATLEYMVETGVMFSWKLIEVWISRSYLALDCGYYMQYAKIPQDDSRIFLANNGLMLRPKFYTLLQIGKHYNVSIGLYYQIPVYPVYNDYKALGAFISVL